MRRVKAEKEVRCCLMREGFAGSLVQMELRLGQRQRNKLDRSSEGQPDTL